MISKIKLKFGRSFAQPPLELELAPLTVFVGPNNSGKSKVLEEIHSFCNRGTNLASMVIVDELGFKSNSDDDAKKELEALKASVELKRSDVPTGHALIGKRDQRKQVNEAEWTNIFKNPNSNLPYYCENYVQFETLRLDRVSRISLVSNQKAGNLQLPPKNTLQALFLDDQKRATVRKVLRDAFGVSFVIDPTNIGNLQIRFTPGDPPSSDIERGWDDRAVAFHASGKLISEFSDGVKAFTGIIIEILAGDPNVLLIDEPEAFLHPSLSAALGKEISKATIGSGLKRVFVSTHSPQFVMGSIQAGAGANIVRLTYRDNKATARVLERGRLEELMRDPLLRSVGALSGLFYEAVVVTEGDADRAFYQEINDRLTEFKPDWGIPNCLFLNAQNKQTVHQIIAPLRELGIPAAAIVDIDIIKEGGKVWSNFLKGGHLPDAEVGPLSQIRQTCLVAFVATGKDMKRDGGIELLTGQQKEIANNLFDKSAEYGLFVVRKGELDRGLRRWVSKVKNQFGWYGCLRNWGMTQVPRATSSHQMLMYGNFFRQSELGFLIKAERAYRAKAGNSTPGPLVGTFRVAPLLPHLVQRAQRRSLSLDTPEPHRMMSGTSAIGALFVRWKSQGHNAWHGTVCKCWCGLHRKRCRPPDQCRPQR